MEHLETLSLPYKVSHLAPTLFAIFALFSRCDVIADKANRDVKMSPENLLSSIMKFYAKLKLIYQEFLTLLAAIFEI